MPTFPNEVDVVFVHKDPHLSDAFAYFARDLDKKIELYCNPQEFLEHVARYPQHTKIILGRTFHEADLQGIPTARQLHAMGFTRLYLFIVDEFS